MSCGEEPRRIPEDFEKMRKKEPIQQGWGVKYLVTEFGQPKVELEARHVFEEMETNNQVCTRLDSGVKMIFYNSQNKIESSLTADRAKLYNQRGYAQATGNVLVTNEKNEKLETEKLNWWRDSKKLTTDAAVRIQTIDETLWGDSLVANTNFTNYKIYKLKGTLKMKN